MKISLPIDPHIPEILEALSDNEAVIVQASPGSGKTTRLPPAILHTLEAGQHILVLEPRRLAAKAAADRVAYEWGEPTGKTIGYQFRFENVTSGETRLRFLTEGMLIRRLLSDPLLKNVAVIVLDEFHERHLHTDVAVSYVRHLQRTTRPDLKTVIMSATLETESLGRFFGQAPVFDIDAPNFTVEIDYVSENLPLETLIARTVKAALVNPPVDPQGRSDILVFLPGMAEIRRAADALRSLAQSSNLLVLPLHGELSREEQNLALNPQPQRKVILSTNVAETSVTIAGVTTVIDSGLARQASHSVWTGLPTLKTKPISQASAIQRAGRAGRTCPGRCIRLYHKTDFDRRPDFDLPEIQRADLAQTLLELSLLGVSKLEWFETPNDPALTAARTLLRRLGALDKDLDITTLGRAMGELPVHPRLSRILLDAKKRGGLKEAAMLVALLSEGTNSRLNIVDELDTRDPVTLRTRDRLLGLCGSADKNSEGDVAMSALTGYPDRVAKLADGKKLLVLCDGGSAQVHDSKILPEGEFFICADVQETQRGTHKRVEARALIPIEPEWLLELENDFLKESNVMAWDPQRQSVFQISKMTYGQLVLDESRTPPKDKVAAASELAKNIGHTPEDLRKICDLESLQSLLSRADFVRAHDPSWPAFDLEKMFLEFCQSVCDNKFSVAELKNSDFIWFLTERLGPLGSNLNQRAPVHVTLPKGRRVRVNYSAHQPPWIESRLQDFFGLRSVPALMDGKVQLTLHLLAPNARAVQVTNDLMSFWKNTYPKLRSELGRRYPRHKWPEDPLTAEPDEPRPPRSPRRK